MKSDKQGIDVDNSGKTRFFFMFEKIANAKIHSKILALVIIICVFSLVSMSVTSYITVKRLSDYALDVNATLGNDATEGAESALIDQAYHYLQIIAYEQSNSCNNILDGIKFNVKIVEDVVQDIFNNPENYSSGRSIIRPSQAVEGVYTSTYALPDSVLMTPGIKREIRLLSNLNLIMPTLAENVNIIDLYVGMKSGLFYNYTTLTFEDPEYDPRTRPWYVYAIEHPEDVVFTEIYEDAFGTGMVITAAKAIFDQNGELIGVAGIDIQLESLKQLILSTRIMDSGYAFILDSTGKYVVHPDLGKEGFNPFPLEDEQIKKTGFAEGYKRMMNGEEGLVSQETGSANNFLTFCPISVAGWSIGVIVSEDEVLSGLKTLEKQMLTLTNESEENILNMSNNAMVIFLLIFILVVVMVAVLSSKLTQIVSNPIQNLVKEAVKIGEGNFEYRIPVKTNDEIGVLTKAFNDMTDNLYRYAQNIISLDLRKAELEVAANTDMLTGIFNRRYFMEIATMRFENTLRPNGNDFIVMLDLDHFKRVNDTYGHTAGDLVLKSIAATIKRSIRPGDLFARYGGEEFVLLVDGGSKKTVQTLIKRIQQNIRKERIEFEGVHISVTASYGVAAAYPGHSLDTVISFADEALYRAKNEGRDRAVFYVPDPVEFS